MNVFLRMSAKRKADIVFESGLSLDKCSIQWKIRNFSAHLSDYLTCATPESQARVLQSREFSTDSGHKWKLVIKKWLNPRNNIYEIDFWIRLLSTHQSMVNINSECSLNINGQQHVTKKSKFCDIKTNLGKCLLSAQKGELVNLLAKHSTEDHDVAVIEVNIEMWSEKTNTGSNGESSKNTERDSKKMTKLWTNQAFTDVTLECQGKELKAHKLILAAASPVFEAMFKEGTKEQLNSCVIIEDIDSDIFEVFLRYLYSGEVDQLAEMYLELFAAADKYDVQSLRKTCIQHMAKNISVDNTLDVLALAERHSIEPLKSLALQFIKTNIANVVESDSWTSLLSNHRGDEKRMRDGGSQIEESARKRKK